MILHPQEPGTLGWPQAWDLGAIWWPRAPLLPAPHRGQRWASDCGNGEKNHWASGCAQRGEKSLGKLLCPKGRKALLTPGPVRDSLWRLLRSSATQKLCPSVSMTMAYRSRRWLLFALFLWMSSSFPYAFHSLPTISASEPLRSYKAPAINRRGVIFY